MTPELVMEFTAEALKVAVLLAAPMLLFGLIAGLVISIFQAVTQINEITLTLIPKMLAVVLALVIFFPWMLNIFLNFTSNLFSNIPNYIR